MRWAAVLVTVAGCSVGEGTGAVSGSVFLTQCTKDTALGSPSAPAAFDLHPTYFVADPVRDLDHLHPMNHVAIRVQTAGNRIEEADGILFNVADTAEIAALIGQPVPVGAATNLRATLGLYRSCPKRAVQMELDGTITFTRFGEPQNLAAGVPDSFAIHFGDSIAASFHFDIVDRRALTLGGTGSVTTAPEAGGHLDGNFDFVVRQGRAAQAYP